MKNIILTIYSSIGWFGIMMVIAGIIACVFLSRKHLPKMRLGLSDVTAFPALLAIIALAASVIILICMSGAWLWGLGKDLSSNFEAKWWIAAFIIVIVIMLIDLFIHRGKDGEKGKDWKARWSEWRSKFYFTILWSIVILILNLVLWHLEIEAWQDLWFYKGTGSWFFSMIMILLVASMVLIVNVEMTKLRWCGGILLFIALASWTRVALTSDRGAIARQAAEEERRLVEAQKLRERIRSGQKVTISKDATHPVEFVWRDIQGLSSVPILMRLNKEGDFIRFEPGTVEKPGPLSRLDPRITVVEILPAGYDIEVFYKADSE